METHAPHLVGVACDLGHHGSDPRWLTDEQCADLVQAALNGFLSDLDADDEPGRAGVEADDLLGRIEMQRRGYWRG
jgi:hypothetical protein